MAGFPSRSGVRAFASLVLLAGMAAPVVAVPAASDDLEDRRDSVRRELARSERELDQSSADLLRATRALAGAQQRLTSAQRRLARSRGELAAAEVLDRRMQAQLEAAEARLRRARAAVREGRVGLAGQRDQLGRVVVESYQQGGPALLGLSLVLTSRDPAQLSGQLNSARNVMEAESAMLARLEASQVLLAVQEQELREAKTAVARRRRAAAEKLALKESLQTRAEAATARVAMLVAERSEAKRRAAEAMAADRRQLRELRGERQRIAELLQRRAEAARRRAEAARDRPSRSATRPPLNDGGGLLSYPVDSYITSPYGMRLHPVYKRWNLHDGTDFGAGCGTPIRAAADGRVVANYYNSAYGNRVIIDHGYQRGAGLGTAYNHMTSYTTSVGQQVRRGDVIGYAGTTGYSTGCHLHLMVFRDGATVDPMRWL